MHYSRIFVLLLGLLSLSSCYILKAYKYRHFKLESLRELKATALHKSAQPFYFHEGHGSRPRLVTVLDSILQPTHTYAFLVIRNDSILYERYFDPVKDETLLPSFSVAKSFVSTLVGIALEEGKIKSLQDPITDYLPELKKRDSRLEQVTIQHLLDMRSGVKSVENYDSPFSDVIKLGFTRNIAKQTLKTKVAKPPGEEEYRSVNTQLLGMIVERATGVRLQDYLQQKIWTPLQMEGDATWNVDAKNTVRAFCCLNATARDFAKLGRLYLNQGNWNGQQIISKEWVHACTAPEIMQQYDGYKNQWWNMRSNYIFRDSTEASAFQQTTKYPSQLESYKMRNGQPGFRVSYRTPGYHAEGILNQYVYVQPVHNVVIVRLGYYWDNSSFYPDGLLYWLGERL